MGLAHNAPMAGMGGLWVVVILGAALTPAVADPSLLEQPDALARHLALHRPPLREGDARVAQARAELGQSSLWFQNPAISASTGGWPLGPTNPAGLRLDQVVNASVGISATVDVLKKGPRIHAAQLALQGEKQARVALLVDLMTGARQALATLLFRTARQAILEESLKTARAMANAEALKVERGVEAGLDAERARLEEERLAAEVARAESEVQDAAGACAGALGTPCDVTGSNGLDLLAHWDPPHGTGDDAQVAALRLAAQAQHESSVAEGRAFLPDPTVTLGYTFDRFLVSGNNPSVLGAGISIPIPAFDHGQYRQAAAHGRAMEFSARAEGLEQQRAAALAALRQQEATLHGALLRLETDAIPRAQRLADAMQAAFERGRVPLTDQLLARRALTEVQLQHAELRWVLFGVRSEACHLDGTDTETARTQLGS